MKRWGVILHRVMVTTVAQGAGAPLVDSAIATSTDGRKFHGVAVHLRPWRRNEAGDRAADLALFLGWQK